MKVRVYVKESLKFGSCLTYCKTLMRLKVNGNRTVNIDHKMVGELQIFDGNIETGIHHKGNLAFNFE